MRIKTDVALKQMEYGRHEFVKMTDVGNLIQEAANQLMDKIHEERKTAIANRNLIRTLDAQVKKCQNDMQQFVKTKKQSEEHHKII